MMKTLYLGPRRLLPFFFASYSCSRKHHAEMSVFAWLSVVTLTFAFKTLTKHWDGLFIKIMFCEIQFEIAKARASNQLGKKLFKAIYDQSTNFLSTYVFLPKTPSVPPQKKQSQKNSPNIPEKKNPPKKETSSPSQIPSGAAHYRSADCCESIQHNPRGSVLLLHRGNLGNF